jgi:predicted dehydrogenase
MDIKKLIIIGVSICLISIMGGCRMNRTGFTGEPDEVRFMTLAPGHFHAYLVQKDMYEQVHPTVHVYAPPGPEVQRHLDMIENYNTRAENPTAWNQVVYVGEDYLERMLSEKRGNVVILAGNNQLKTRYINRAVSEGLNVLSDKPMAIDTRNFELLKESFSVAGENNVLLYDIMTERFEITSLLQRELMHMPAIFGQLDPGTPDNPSVIKESVHHFFKYVSGQILRRPPWFFDVNQQGEGIIDVTTHLVDLIQWACFPEQVIDYESDIKMFSARRWPTEVTLSQFSSITGESGFPGYLDEHVRDTILQVYSNGEMNYSLKGIHSRVIVKWDYRAPEGAGDTHYSVSRGTNASLVIRQGPEQGFRPVLYIEHNGSGDPAGYEEVLTGEFQKVRDKFPGIELKRYGKDSWEVVVPAVYDAGHEAHFAQVTQNFLQYLVDGRLPDWEVPNMIAKYYTITRALEIARE